jgi:predicted PurR-regulated permease PerM
MIQMPKIWSPRLRAVRRYLAVFINSVDNFIRPWLIGFGIAMPMSLAILGFAGFIFFGSGLLIGPTLIAIMFTLLQVWRTAVASHPAATNVPNPVPNPECRIV